MGAADRIKELELELKNTPYNKATEHHFGVVKARIAQLKERLEIQSAKKGGGQGFSVRKSGDGTVILVGFPSVGKSTLLNSITGTTTSEIGHYAFTTLTVVPGMLKYNHAKIQILDVPGILKGAATGTGRGREVLSTVQSADLILLLIDAAQPQAYPVLLDELYKFNVRVNQEPPHIKITKTSRGGVTISSTVKLTKIKEKTILDILREFRINNADVLFRENCTADQLIDVIRHNRHYITAAVVVNKSDMLSPAQRKKIVKDLQPDLMVSAKNNIGIGDLKDLIYDKLGLVRIFLKEINKPADMEEPMIMRNGSTIKDVCDKIHRTMIKRFKYARLWGSSKFDGQIIRKTTRTLHDGDVLEVHTT